MASRVPNEENDESIRPMLGWDQAIAALQRNLLQQQQQQQQQQQANHTTNLNQAAMAALATGLTPPTSLANAAGLPQLWPYNLGAAGMIPPAAAAAAASLASLGNPTNNYLNHLQNMHNPESILSFQQNLLLLEQIQQQRQLLATNPHLLMAVAAAQSGSGSLASPQLQLPNVSPATSQPGNNQPTLQHHLNSTSLLHQHHHHNQLPLLNGSPKLNGALLGGPGINGGGGGPMGAGSVHVGANGVGSGSSSSICSSSSSSSTSCLTNSLLTTVNSNLTNQHQDSLVDQHFRRSLGEDYNQIMSAKADKINVAK